MSSSSLLIPTASVATPAVLPPIQGNLAVQGAYAQPILLYMGKAASTDPTQTAPTYAGAAANQPATQTLVFFVPGALATDVVFVSKNLQQLLLPQLWDGLLQILGLRMLRIR